MPIIMLAGGGNFPPFDTTTFPSQLLWLAITFGALYFVMSKVIVPRIGGILETRENTISADLKKAEQAKAEADKAASDFEKSLSDARNSANKLAADTRAQMALEQEATKKSLEANLASKMQVAEGKIKATKQQALASVQDIAAEATQALITQLTGKTVNAADLKSAIAKFA